MNNNSRPVSRAPGDRDAVVLYRNRSPALVVTRYQVDDRTDVLVFVGELCTVTSPGAAAPLSEWLGLTDVSVVHLDLADVEFLDGRGVTLLVALLDIGRSRGRTLRLTRRREAVRKLLAICGVDGAFEIGTEIRA